MPSRKSAEARSEAWKVIYLGMGPDRSLESVRAYGTDMGLSRVPALSTLKRWSKQFNWVEKAEAFDRDRALALRDMTLDRAIVNDIEHAEFGRAMRKVVQDEGIGALSNFEGWTPMHVARLGDTAVKIERIASGQATERREILLPFVNMLTGEIARAFLTSVAAVDLDPDDEAAIADEFARQVDHIIESHFVVLGIEAEVDDEEEPDYVDAIASSAD